MSSFVAATANSSQPIRSLDFGHTRNTLPASFEPAKRTQFRRGGERCGLYTLAGWATGRHGDFGTKDGLAPWSRGRGLANRRDAIARKTAIAGGGNVHRRRTCPTPRTECRQSGFHLPRDGIVRSAGLGFLLSASLPRPLPIVPLST